MIISLIGLEGLLRLVDPLGVWVYSMDVYRHNLATQPHESGYRLKAGFYDWASYDVTILADGTRLVPANQADSDCTIAAIGDSFTFGHSVNDAETFTNRLAEHVRAHWLNTGRQGYAVDNVRRLQSTYPADGYLYFIVSNDGLQPISRPTETHIPRALEAYINWYAQTSRNPQADVSYFMATLAQFDLDTTLLVGFARDVLAQTAIRTYSGVLIASDYPKVSKGDGHPNAEGHQQIASALLPYIKSFTQSMCPP